MSSLDEQIQKNLDEHDRLMETDETYRTVYNLSKKHMQLLSNEEARDNKDYRKAIADAMRLDAKIINELKLERANACNKEDEQEQPKEPVIEEKKVDKIEDSIDKIEAIFSTPNGKYKLPVGLGVSLSILLIFIRQLALPELSALIIITPLVLDFTFAILMYFVHTLSKALTAIILSIIDTIDANRDMRKARRLMTYAEQIQKLKDIEKEKS